MEATMKQAAHAVHTFPCATDLTLDCDSYVPDGLAASISELVRQGQSQAHASFADAMYQNKAHRIGPTPTAQQIEYANRVCLEACHSRQPVRTLTPWGALKGYGVFATSVGADILDIMALRRLIDTINALRQHAKAGVRSTVMIEDVTERFLNPDAPVQAMQDYTHDLQCAALAMGAEDLEIVMESELIHRIDWNESIVTTRALMNAEEINLVMQIPESLREGRLRSMGWMGTLSDQTIAWYMDRTRSEKPDATDAESRMSIARYMGLSLARKQAGYTRYPIKLSFAPYPPGVDSGMLMGRVDLKTKLSKSNGHVPPWVGYGVFDTACDFRMVGVGGMRKISTKPVRVTFSAQRALGDFPATTTETAAFTAQIIN